MEGCYQDESDEVLINQDAKEEDGWQLEYSLKLIKCTKMSEFKLVRVGNWKCFKNLKDLWEFLSSKLPTIKLPLRSQILLS